MTTNWKFDEEYLKSLLERSKKRLETTPLSSRKRKNLETDIRLFEQFLTNQYEGIDVKHLPLPKNIDDLKDKILKKMHKCYKTLGEPAIDWALSLDEDQFFYGFGSMEETELGIEDQAQLTIANYKKISPVFYKTSKQMLYPSGPSKIHIADFLDCSSYSHHVEITDEPILIVDPYEAPWIFNHELQHAVEELLGYKTNYYYQELGSHYVEPHFLERLYEQQGFIRDHDYKKRLQDTSDSISETENYLLVLKLFAQTDFKVSTDDFLSILSEYEEVPKEVLSYHTIATYYGEDEQSSLMYLFSYLKAIELYEESREYKGDHSVVLKPYLKSKKFQYTPPEEGYKVYEKFINRMEKLSK